MKKIISRIREIKNFNLVALCLMGAATFAACASDDDAVEQKRETPATGKYTMTIKASKGAETRMLTPGTDGDGKPTMNATWAAGETVDVYNGTEKIGTLSATEISGESCTLTGDVDPAPSVDETLTLKFCSPTYSSQDGTLEYISAHCDYAEATVTVKAITGNTITINEDDAEFENQQAIIKFALMDKGNSNAAISPSALTVTDGTNTVSLTDIPEATYTNTTNGDGVLYVAFPAAGSEKPITLTATVGSDTYTYEKSGVTFTNGEYYAIAVKMEKQVSLPTGAINGLFSVSSTQQVYFSQGNLQATYNGSAWSWAFAENQWDYVGNDAANTSINDNGTVSEAGYNEPVDLFGWSTSSTYYGINNSTTDGDYSGGFREWGDNIGTGWRTLSKEEWLYLINTRTNATNLRTMATVNNVAGLIIMPDGWTANGVNLNIVTNFTANNISETDWATLQSQGCVFLPAAGYRSGTTLYSVNSNLMYWSSTQHETSATNAYRFQFSGSAINTPASKRGVGESVRLVYDVQ